MSSNKMRILAFVQHIHAYLFDLFAHVCDMFTAEHHFRRNHRLVSNVHLRNSCVLFLSLAHLTNLAQVIAISPPVRLCALPVK